MFSPDRADQLHDKFRDEQYKADVQGRAMIYPVKADFGDLTLDSFSDQFSGPLYVQIFTPDIADYDVLTFTCCWNDGIFRNDCGCYRRYRRPGEDNMKPLQNILDLSQFTSLVNEEKDSYSSLPWWEDCISQVEIQLLSDKTTSQENLREKAKNYASNYIAMQTETSYINKDQILEEIADEVEKKLKDISFDQRPAASVVAQNARMNIQKEPENKFIKLG